MRWILPVKHLTRGKSRLRTQIPHEELILAMLADTIDAVIGTHTGGIVVVTPDPRVRDLAQRQGADVLIHDGDLNAAISAATCPGMCAALLPDLPAVRSQELLDIVSGTPSGFVPDAAGTGTTLAFAPHLIPRFGPGSAAAFAANGLPRLQAGPGLRCDVDTDEDLRAAQQLGVGRHTSALITRVRGRSAVRTGP